LGKINFDHFAEDYNQILSKRLSFFESSSDYFAQYKVSVLKKLLKRQPSRILEFGCGVGSNIGHLITAFPNVTIAGCDISQKCLEVAAKGNPSTEFFCLDVSPSAHKESFDLVFIANVFHHIPPAQQKSTVMLIRQLMTKTGDLFIFEHNPYNPVTRHIVNTCPFDADAQLLKPKALISQLESAGFSIVRKHYILFFPAFLNKLRPLERFLVRLPLGGQYVIHASM
jgi:SAM-dependent methyltransferase